MAASPLNTRYDKFKINCGKDRKQYDEIEVFSESNLEDISSNSKKSIPKEGSI